MPRVTVKHPKTSTPLDLGENLCAELAHLFRVELDPIEHPEYGLDGVARMNYEATSRELAWFAIVLRKRRLGDVERNLAPWEKMPAAEQIRAYRRQGR